MALVLIIFLGVYIDLYNYKIAGIIILSTLVGGYFGSKIQEKLKKEN